MEELMTGGLSRILLHLHNESRVPDRGYAATRGELDAWFGSGQRPTCEGTSSIAYQCGGLGVRSQVEVTSYPPAELAVRSPVLTWVLLRVDLATSVSWGEA
eukprot:1031084-Rhodomonas_salina.4